MYTETNNWEIKNVESEIRQTEGRITDLKKDLTGELKGLNKLREEHNALIKAELSVKN